MALVARSLREMRRLSREAAIWCASQRIAFRVVSLVAVLRQMGVFLCLAVPFLVRTAKG